MSNDSIDIAINTRALDEAQAKADKLLSTLRQIHELHLAELPAKAPSENVQLQILEEQKRANEKLERLLRALQANCSLVSEVLSL